MVGTAALRGSRMEVGGRRTWGWTERKVKVVETALLWAVLGLLKLGIERILCHFNEPLF